MACKHNSSKQLLYTATDYISKQPFEISRCSDCHLAITEADDKVIHNEEHYPADYYGKTVRYHPLLAQIVNFLARRRLNYLDNLQEKGEMLDIGCGQGWFVKQFSHRGWNSLGVEVSDTAAYHARTELGLNIVVGEEATQSLESNKYDVIGLWHVLEHVEDPSKILDEINRLLKDDGQALVGVPNFGSTEAKLGKDGWFHLDVPRHLYHFDRSNINQLSKDAGLKITKTMYFVPEYDFFSFIQTAQNRIGIKMNFLYQTIRQGTLETSSKPARLRDWVGLVITTPILLAVSLVWVPIAALTKNGSSLVLILRKTNA